VDALIADVAVPIVEIPVPVVMKPVFAERSIRRGAFPQIVVYAIGNRLVRGTTDGVAPFIAKSLSVVDLADVSLAQELNRFLERFAATALGSVLDDTLVLRRPPPICVLRRRYASRFFDVDILARLAGPDAHDGMPVIGGGDGYRIEFRVFQHLPVIHIRFDGSVCFLLPFFLALRRTFSSASQKRTLAIGEGVKRLDMIVARP
jgi:hypothetical protein